MDLPAHLAGQGAKTALKRELQPVDNDKIAYRQVLQHQVPLGRSLHCSFWRSMAK